MINRPITLRMLAATILLMSIIGCGDTIAKRKEISRHTKDLAAIVKADPESEDGQKALAELIVILNGKWSFARSQACYVLDSLGPLAAPAVPDLIRAAKCGDMFVEQDSVRALASIGPAAAPAIDLMAEEVESAVSESREGLRAMYAVQGVGNIGDAALKTIPLLKRATRSENDLLAHDAQISLEKLQRLEKAKSDAANSSPAK